MKLNGQPITDFRALRSGTDPEIVAFLEEWFNERDTVAGHTSGSTGKPKEILLKKQDMRASARITNNFFKIGKDSVLLLCLSVSYIAGKMMVVRALEADADLWAVPVCSHPLRTLTEDRKFDLAAMVPLQVEESLKVAEERSVLMNIRQLLVGGAPVSPELERQLLGLPVRCYATYGMTETVSHVALRRIGGGGEYFAVGDVEFAADERGCLLIDAPHLETKHFVTNDMVEVVDRWHFVWLGRWDHVINSGGIKFFPEVIEQKISCCLECRFFISSLPDKRLGERLVLVLESEKWSEPQERRLFDELKKLLSPYEMPRELIYLSRFYETGSGKIIRKLS